MAATAKQKAAIQAKYVASQEKLVLNQLSALFGRALTATEQATAKAAMKATGYAVGSTVWDKAKKKYVNKAPANFAEKYGALIQAASGVKGKYDAASKSFQALDSNGNVVTDRSKWVDAANASATSIYKVAQSQVQANFGGYQKLLDLLGPSHANELLRIAAGSTSADEFLNKFYASDAYKARFPGMDAFRKDHPNGNEAEYIAMENAYQRTLTDYGMDTASVFGTSGSYERQVPDPAKPGQMKTETVNLSGQDWQRYQIGRIMQGGISIAEYGQRVRDAHEFTVNANPEVKRTLQALYGVTDTDLKTWILNPEIKQQAIAKLESAVTLGETALKSGMTLGGPKITGIGLPTTTSTAPVEPVSMTPQGEYSSNVTGDFLSGDYLQNLGTRTVGANATLEERQAAQARANAAVSAAGAERDTSNLLAGISNTSFTQEQQVEAQLATGQFGEAERAAANQNALKTKKRLASEERARFSGSSGGTQILGQNLSGSF